MLKTLSLVLTFLAWPLSTSAQETAPPDPSILLKEIQKETGVAAPCNNDEADRCGDLSDQFCKEFYSPKYQGNYRDHGAQFAAGWTPSNALRADRRIDLLALVESAPRLPADLRKEIGPTLAHLKKLLAHEQNTREWLRSLKRDEDEVKAGLEAVAQRRVFQKHPDQRKRDLLPAETHEDLVRMAVATADLKHELTRAKYEKHPNWLRVKALFEEVRADLRETLKSAPISDPDRELALTRLNHVQLVMPDLDPRLAASGEELGGCPTTLRNAVYNPESEMFTICAGEFNAFPSPGALYLTIAHELSHSYDGQRIQMTKFMATPLGQTLNQLCNAQTTAFDCKTWAQIKSTQLVLPTTERSSVDPYPALNQCLVDRSELEPWTLKAVNAASSRLGRKIVGLRADARDWTELVQPTRRTSEGKILPNPLYLRPDHYEERSRAYLPRHAGTYCGVDVSPKIFMQEWICRGGKEVSQDDRAELLTATLKDTRDLTSAAFAQASQYCQRDCFFLVDDNLAKPANEADADWFAQQGIRRKLARMKTIEERRRFVLHSNSAYCAQPGVYADADDLREAEGEVALDSHPDDRPRRLAVFTPEISELVKCTPEEDVAKGAARCKL